MKINYIYRIEKCIRTIIEQLIPAYVTDLLLVIARKRPLLVNTYVK